MKKKPEKKCSLRNEKLKANKASETKEQRKERLRIRREKEGEQKNYKRERKGRQKQKTTRNGTWPTLKRLKRCDEHELERKLRLEKVVASKQLRDGKRKKSKTGK